jgi:oligo-alginate lyase
MTPVLRFALVLVVMVISTVLDRLPAAELPPALWSSLPPHPRLFANAARWDQLRAELRNDAVAQQLFALIRERAEGVLTAPSLALAEKGDFLHGPMRQIQGRIAALAMVYRVTADVRFLARAKQEMQELATTPHWRPGHFLSTAEATLAMAIGLDWLYDELTPDERTRYGQAIIDRGLKISLDEENKHSSWVTSAGNWGPVCHGALAVGALAVAELAPELASRIVNRSIANVSFAAAKYAPAGAHSEGPGYWAYGTNFYCILTEALRTSFGTTCGLEQAPGFFQTGDYNLQMTTPTGQMFNHNDSVPEFGFEPAMFWFARETHRRLLVEPTLERLTAMHDILVGDSAQPDASRLQPLALLWWDPSLPVSVSGTSPGALTWWSGASAQPHAVMRSAWNDRRAVYVGLKAGAADESHAHMDAGSFLIEANGVRWAVDLGRDSYQLPRRNGLGAELFDAAQDSRRWAIFRAGPESHNILRFNNAVPLVSGRAELRPTTGPLASAGFIMDLSATYGDQITSAQRGVSLRPDRRIVIRDEWRTGERAVAVAWQWLTFANVTLNSGGAVLTQNGETLRLRVVSPANAHLAVEDLSRPVNAWDSPNPELKRIVVRVRGPAQSNGALVVVVDPDGDGTAADPLCELPLAQW